MRAFKASVMSCGISDISEEADGVALRCTGKQYISLQHVWHFSQLCLTLEVLKSVGALSISYMQQKKQSFFQALSGLICANEQKEELWTSALPEAEL